jgi:hypothetical protein
MDMSLYKITYDLRTERSNYTQAEGYECNCVGFSTDDCQQSLLSQYKEGRVLIHSIHKLKEVDMISFEITKRDTIKNMGWVQKELAHNSNILDGKKTSKIVWMNRGR